MATPEELKDLDSVLDRIREANQALYKTVDKEIRATIQAQLTELDLEKDLIMTKIDVRNKVNWAQEDLASILRRLEQANQALYTTVDMKLRTTIETQLAKLNLEKDLAEAKIDVLNKVDGAQERVTRSQEALDAFKRSAAAPVGTFLFAVALLPCLFDCLVWSAHPSLSLFLSLSLSLQRHPTRRTRPHCLRRSLRSRRHPRPTCASTSRRSC